MSQAQFGTFDDLLRIAEESVRPIEGVQREVSLWQGVWGMFPQM